MYETWPVKVSRKTATWKRDLMYTQGCLRYWARLTKRLLDLYRGKSGKP